MKLALLAAGFLLLALLTQASATTNYNGSASFTTTRGLNNIAAYCPDQTYCTSQLADVQNTSYLDFTCSCKLASITINATWKDDNASSTLNGKPVTFLNVFEDNNLLGTTGLVGLSRIGDVEYGLHVFTFTGCTANPAGGCAQNLTASLLANITKPEQRIDVTVSKTALFNPISQSIPQTYDGPTTLAWSNGSIRPQVLPLFVYVLAIVLPILASDAFNIATNVYSYTIAPYLVWDDLGRAQRCFDANNGTVLSCPLESGAVLIDIIPGTNEGSEIGIQVAGRVSRIPIIGQAPKIVEAISMGKGEVQAVVESKIGKETVEQIIHIFKGGAQTEAISRNAAGALKEWGSSTAASVKIAEATSQSVTIGKTLVPKSELIYAGSKAGNIKGALGERSAYEIIQKTAAKHGGEVIPFTITNTLKKGDWIFWPSLSGKGIKYKNAITGIEGELDLAAYVGSKPIAIEVKTGAIGDIARQMEGNAEALGVLLGRNDVESLAIVASNYIDAAILTGKKVISFSDNSNTFEAAARKLAGRGG